MDLSLSAQGPSQHFRGVLNPGAQWDLSHPQEGSVWWGPLSGEGGSLLLSEVFPKGRALSARISLMTFYVHFKKKTPKTEIFTF